MFDLGDGAFTVMISTANVEPVFLPAKQRGVNDELGPDFARTEMIDNDPGADRDLPWLQQTLYQVRPQAISAMVTR